MNLMSKVGEVDEFGMVTERVAFYETAYEGEPWEESEDERNGLRMRSSTPGRAHIVVQRRHSPTIWELRVRVPAEVKP